jgi:hypothetical protein
MTRNNINVSFPEDETKLYKELILESSQTYVPIATLSRKYMRLGMQSSNRKSFIS